MYFSNSNRLKIKHNVIKNSLSDALVLSTSCDNAFVDNNTVKNNGDSTSGRAVRLYEVDNVVLYNNSIESNDYSGLVITASSDNKIIQNIIKGNGKYGIQVSNDLTKSANNTIKSNTINDNQDEGLHIAGIYTKIISNEIKYNEKDGITAKEYSSTLKKKKKSNMNPEVWFISQLSLIQTIITAGLILTK